MLIVEATIRDLDDFCAMERICFSPSEAFDKATYKGLLSNSYIIKYKFVTENKTIGFVLGRVDVFPHGAPVSTAQLITIDVLPEHRRHRVATKLIEKIVNTFKVQGAAKVLVEVRASNAAAREMYAKLGFRELGTLKNFYAKGVDGLIAEKWL